MDIKEFVNKNKWALLIGTCSYVLFLYFSYSGNRICDCQSTEKYNDPSSRGRSSINRFYHK
jgi:hypothetical protein